MSKYIPDEMKVFNNQKLPWMNAEIEKLFIARNDVFKKHLQNNRNCYYTYKCKALQWKPEDLIKSSKQTHYKRVFGNLSSVSTSSKCYWSLLKRILNDKNIPVIPPLFHNSNFIFKENSNYQI